MSRFSITSKFALFILFFSVLIGGCMVSTIERKKKNIGMFKNSRLELKKVFMNNMKTDIIRLTDSSILNDTRLIETQKLYKNRFIGKKGKLIYFYKDGSILFVTPQKGKYIVFDPRNSYEDRCNFRQIKYLLEKDWYFLLSCDD